MDQMIGVVGLENAMMRQGVALVGVGEFPSGRCMT